MENIDQRLKTISPKRQEQFKRILGQETGKFGFLHENFKQEIIEKTKSRLLKYLANEEKEKLIPRKHGSKGKKHRQRGPEQIRRIEKKLDENKLNYALLVSELFNVSLREKHSHKGIRYIGLCPFHDEKTPSFSVAPDIGFIKCFGCGRGQTPVYLLSNVFNIKYSRVLGMLEKYIYTPEESKEWKKENQRIMEFYKPTPEQQEKKEFTAYLHKKSGYLPKKKFDDEFRKWKKGKVLKVKEEDRDDYSDMF